MNKTHLVKVPMENTLNLNEFFVEGENQELSHVLLHIIQPSTPEEEREKGYFFAACEINNTITGNRQCRIDTENSHLI